MDKSLGHGKGRTRERGASLVEFALIAPFWILLLLGIIEFGYLFGEFNDVRHGAREGARVAAVNAGDNGLLHATTCDAMDLTTNITVRLRAAETGIWSSCPESSFPTRLCLLSFVVPAH